MQVQELQLPISALVQYQQYLAWQGSTRGSSIVLRAAAPATAAPGGLQRLNGLQNGRHHTSIQQQQNNGAEINTAGEASGSKAAIPESLLRLLVTHMPNVTSISLHHNSISQPNALGKHLQQLQLVPQITALDLRDSCSWGMPCSNLSEITVLTQLRKLQWLVQSPGMPQGSLQGHMVFPPAATGWQQRVSRGFEAVKGLTGLQHLQLRFVCGERGM